MCKTIKIGDSNNQYKSQVEVDLNVIYINSVSSNYYNSDIHVDQNGKQDISYLLQYYYHQAEVMLF